MEFEVLHRSKKKKFLIAGCFLVVILAAIAIGFTFAKYKVTASIPLASGTINYVPYDFSILAMEQQNDGGTYDPISKMPGSDYTINTEKSYCTVNGVKDTNAKLETIDGNHTIANLQVGSKCHLYFDKGASSAGETILAHFKTVKTRSLPFTTSTTVTDTTTGTIYKAQDDWGDTYYFAGNPTDNWVKFAGFYWRIVRINGDGSIRLIYSGQGSPATTGSSTMINSSQAFNSSYNRSEYVGYMYTTSQQHGNTTDSPIKDVLDSWYSSNLASYADKISKEAGFCGDREMTSGYSWSSQPSSTIYYAGYGRLVQNSSSVNPTLKCSNSNDLYTTSSSSKGNKKLANPIGLITADEVVMAGGSWSSGNSSYYLYNSANYWTMSPYRVYFNGSLASVFIVYSGGRLGIWDVNNALGVRPVINLSADVKVTGSGTSSDPFVVS